MYGLVEGGERLGIGYNDQIDAYKKGFRHIRKGVGDAVGKVADFI